MIKNIKEISKKILYILNNKQKILCVLVFFVTVFGSLLECLGVTMIIPMVNVIVSPKTLMNNKYIQMVPGVINLGYEGLVILIIGIVIGVYLFKNIFFIFMSWLRVKFSCKMQREVSIKMMESYMNRGYQFFLNKDFGELSHGVGGDASKMYVVINTGFKLFSDAITIVLICIFMFIADRGLALTMAGVSCICILLIYYVFRRSMYKTGIQGRIYSEKAGQALVQAFSGIKDVLVLRKQKHFVDSYEENIIQGQLAQCKTVIGQESPSYIIESLCISGILIVVGRRVLSGEEIASFLGILATFAVAAFRVLPCLGRISVSLNVITNAMPSIDALYINLQEAADYASKHPEVKFGEEKKYTLIDKKIKKTNSECGLKDKITNIESFHKAVELRDVTFSYGDELGNVLEHVNLTIAKGQSVGFIGASGAGKSTLVDILLGLLVPSSGAIFMDDIKITEIPERWSKTIGYVPQTVFLLSASILENVAFGEDLCEIDEAQAWEAIEKAELADFVRSLPAGIMTKTGDRGVRLSGGQRQRIAIARALYHKPEILVLDEATSALDNETEAAVMSAIDSLQGQVTMIIVAHRLTTVRNCDMLYEVGNKTIIKRNTKEILYEAGILEQ